MKKRIQKTLCYSILLSGFGILYFLWYQGTGLAVPCFFHVLTGLYCPGCGITRCLSHLLLFDVKAAVSYNMAVVFLLPFLAYILGYALYTYIRYGKIIFHRLQNFLLIGCLIVLILFGILRNLPWFSFLQPGYGLSF